MSSTRASCGPSTIRDLTAWPGRIWYPWSRWLSPPARRWACRSRSTTPTSTPTGRTAAAWPPRSAARSSLGPRPEAPLVRSARAEAAQCRGHLGAEPFQRRARLRIAERAEGERAGEVIASRRLQHLGELSPYRGGRARDHPALVDGAAEVLLLQVAVVAVAPPQRGELRLDHVHCLDDAFAGRTVGLPDVDVAHDPEARRRRPGTAHHGPRWRVRHACEILVPPEPGHLDRGRPETEPENRVDASLAKERDALRVAAGIPDRRAGRLTGPDRHLDAIRLGAGRVDGAALEGLHYRIENLVVSPLGVARLDSVAVQFVGVAALAEPDLETSPAELIEHRDLFG